MSNEDLVLQIQAGNNNLMEVLWEQNKALVYTVVKRYTNLAELDDLMQECYLGLCKAVESYNPDAGAAFSTYAVNGIRRSVLNYLRAGKSVKVPAWQQELVYKWQQLRKEFEISYNREPTEREACYYLNINKRKLLEVKKAAIAEKVTSLDVPIGDDETLILADTLKSPNNDFEDIDKGMDHQNMKKDLWAAVDGLEDMQAKVIHLRFQGNLTMKQIGEHLGVTESNARTLENKGLRKLRHSSVTKKLKPYYDEYMAAAYRRTSLSSFRYTFTSSEEWHILQREERGQL